MFFPKNDNLGELMSTVCSVHVEGWTCVGACSAEGVRGTAGSASGRLGVRGGELLFRVAPADFIYTNFSGGRGLHFTHTNFSGGRGLHFTYTHLGRFLSKSENIFPNLRKIPGCARPCV